MRYEARCSYCGGVIGDYMTAGKCEDLFSEYCSQECLNKSMEDCRELDDEEELEGETT